MSSTRTTTLTIIALFALGACSRSRAVEGVDQDGDAGKIGTSGTTAAILDNNNATTDAGFVSAASELVSVDTSAGGAASRTLLSAPSLLNQTIDIPKGTFSCGTAPGDEGREPAIEPALVPLSIGREFRIDALPYPNDPSAAPVLASSAGEAARLCAEKGNGGRLCTEIEWERACKGPNGDDTFATGAIWNAECDRAPSRCASGFNVRAMGFLREWTETGVRGAKHRCGSRIRPASSKGSAAVRCCYGDRNEVAMPSIEAHSPFRKTNLDASDLAKIFASVPELSRISSENVKLYSDADVKGSILARSSATADGITFATAPILWSPEVGVEVVVATGRAKKASFVVALWPLTSSGENGTAPTASDKYRFASSLILLGDIAPLALAYEPSHKRELRWTSCWGCAGEQGMVSLREDGRIVIVQ